MIIPGVMLDNPKANNELFYMFMLSEAFTGRTESGDVPFLNSLFSSVEISWVVLLY